MAGYEDTRQKIISTLMGRPNGTEIQPENHQDYALNMLDYIRSLELIATSTLIGIAESNTTPVQPNDSRVCYIAGVAQNQTVTFENFIAQNGNPISITTGDMEGVFVILMWNTQYWSAQTFSTNIISHSESATFYYRYNIRKTYASIALMNADVASPIGTDGKYIKVGDIVTVVNSTTPSENGIYSYEGATDGWKYQSSFNFQLSQSLGSDSNLALSQSSSTNEFRKRFNNCVIAQSPQWTVDNNFNVTIDVGTLDLYLGFGFKRIVISSPMTFVIHSGTDLIVFDSNTNEIKKSSSLTYDQFVLGAYYGTKLFINGNVVVLNSYTGNYTYNFIDSSIFNSNFISQLRQYQNTYINAIVRTNIVLNGNVVNIGTGYIYFEDKKGNEISYTVDSNLSFTIQNDGVLVFNTQDRALYSRIKTQVNEYDLILLFYDAVYGFCLNGLWGYIVLNNKINSLNTTTEPLIPSKNLALYNAMHVIRGSVSINDRNVTLSNGNYYFYDRNGNEYNTTVSNNPTFTLSNDFALCFDLYNKNFLVQNKTSVNNNQIMLLFYDGAMGIVPSGLWATDILNNKINSLNTRVTNLETNTSQIPEFVTIAAKETFNRLSLWINGEETFLIAQITDVHSSGTNKYLHIGYLAELHKLFGFNILWNGGDIGLDTGETLDTAFTLLFNTKTQMQSFCPFLLTKGNHDYGTQAIPTKTINDIFNTPQKRQFTNMVLFNAGYGYVDDTNTKIRTYIINTSEVGGGYNISQGQLQWLADTLKTLEQDWGVVVLSHLCVDPIGRWVSYPTDASGAYFDTLRSIMSALVSKSSGVNATSGVSWNFTNVPTSVKLICSFAGDSHFNNFATTNGVNYIVRQGYGGISDSEMPIGATKDPFSYTTQCLFDILAVKKNGNAKIFRIGAGGETRDLEFTY